MPTPQTLVAGPYLYQLSNSQALIWWQTDIPGTTTNYVSWWKPGPVTPTSVTAKTYRTFSALGTELYFHHVTLTGLSAGSLHYYTVNGDQLTTSTRLFTTYASDGTQVKLGVFGNSGSNTTSSLPGLQNTITALLAQGVQGFLGTGGYTSLGTSYESWRDYWITPLSGILGLYGFSGCRGQSDGYSLAPTMMPYLSDSQDVFEMTVGTARIIALNSVTGTPRQTLQNAQAQADWLLNYAIQRAEWKNALYRVILVHHPDRVSYWNVGASYGDTGGVDTYLSKYLYPLLTASGADLVLFGASSSYQRGIIQSTYATSPHLIHHINVAGGGAYKHATKTCDWTPPNQPSMQFESSNYTAGLLSIDSSAMRFDAFDLETSAVVDSISVTPHLLV